MGKWAKGFEYSSQKRKYTWKDAVFYPQEQCKLIQPGTVLICQLADLLAQGCERSRGFLVYRVRSLRVPGVDAVVNRV